MLPSRGDSENSWSISCQEIEEKGYDLKAVNPNGFLKTNSRTRENCCIIAEKNGRGGWQLFELFRTSMVSQKPGFLEKPGFLSQTLIPLPLAMVWQTLVEGAILIQI